MHVLISYSSSHEDRDKQIKCTNDCQVFGRNSLTKWIHAKVINKQMDPGKSTIALLKYQILEIALEVSL